jgi:siderophore synthetase component
MYDNEYSMLYVHVYQYAAIVQQVFLHTTISTVNVAGTGLLITVHVAGTGLLSIKHVLK